MPGGRMYLAKAFRKPQRKYRKKSSTFRKAVSAIAKKTIMRTSETKTGVTTHNVNFGSNGSFTGGLWASIVNGTGQNNRIGDEIQTLGLRMRGHVNIDGASFTSGREYAGYRLMVVSGKRPLTSADLPQFKGAVDPEALNVHYDRYFKLNGMSFANFLNTYIKFKRNVKYVSGIPSRNEIYVWLIPAPLGTFSTTAGYQVNVDFQLYYKDI